MKLDNSATSMNILRARIGRAIATAQWQAGKELNQSHEMADGSIQNYRINGIKSLEQFEDELLTLFIWTWSLKDYIKTNYEATGKNPALIEELVNNSKALQYVADVANQAKHGELRKSRSGQFATLQDLSFTVPQTSVSTITFGANSMTIDTKFPEKVVLRAYIKPRELPPVDAFEVLSEAITTWESINIKNLP